MQITPPFSPHAKQRLRYLGLTAALGLAAMALSLFFFCPDFVVWKGLHIEETHRYPEINRAAVVLKQLHDPFIKVANDTSNRVVQWRLLLPIIGHYLHFPEWLFLSIPWIGVLAALAYVAHLMLREGRSRLEAFFVASIIGSCSWFFAATGWLTYADSWYLLGLLVVSFSPSRIAIAIFCLLEPFIDERFILGLPIAFVARMIYFELLERARRKQLIRDALVIACLSVPYVLLRLILLLRKADAGSDAYITNQLADMKKVRTVFVYPFGLWMGLRAGWVFVIALFWIIYKQRKNALLVLLSIVTLLTIATSLGIAADIGRSCSSMVPAAMIGIVLMLRYRPTWMRRGLPIVLAANLILPAYHVITLFHVPVTYLWAQIDLFNDPPTLFRAETYFNTGTQAWNQQQLPQAKHLFDVALQLDDDYIPAYLSRAMVNVQMKNLNAATADVVAAMQREPRNPDVLYVRGYIALQWQDIKEGRRWLQDALQIAPADWANRENCQRLLQQTEQGGDSGHFGL